MLISANHSSQKLYLYRCHSLICYFILKRKNNNTKINHYTQISQINPFFIIGDLEHLHKGSHAISSAEGLQRESDPLKPVVAGVCWYWAAEQTQGRTEQTSCYML